MPDFDPNTILVAPVDDIIQQMAQSVANAQLALDRATLEAQKALQQRPEFQELRALGYQPSWYTIPEATFELKLAFYIEDTTGETGGEEKGGIIRRIFGTTHNATYQNSQSFQAEGASTLRVRIVPVPPSQIPPTPTGE
jgi:hypothetical protein